MVEDYQLIFSSLCQTIFYYGRNLNILIYKDVDTEWMLEIVEGKSKSALWKDTFATDQLALNEALTTVEDNRIDSLLGQPLYCLA